MNNLDKKLFFLLVFTAWAVCARAQQNKPGATSVTIAAGPEYERSPFYQSLWGHNYRREWTTPVTFPVAMLDTLYGGLKPYKKGGGHQSKSLHLRTNDGKEYVMRSVNKSLKIVIPKIFYNTFAEDIVNDEISMSHPYAALTIPGMAGAAKIFHTNPRYVYIPHQAALDTFNEEYGNRLYLLEQRPDGDWSDAGNLGNFDKFSSSEDVREKLFRDSRNIVNQQAFVKARLFDMFIGDWDRHEDQWKWGAVEKNGRTEYTPVPVDRDQPYSRFDGVLLKAGISAAGARYFQSFDFDIPYPQGYSYERRNIDRFFTNRVTLKDWQFLAKQLQDELTDISIEKSVRELPPEIFTISGNEIIAKLKSRRGHLVEYATKYYLFIAKNVDIVGTQENEYFEVTRMKGETSVNVYDIKGGIKAERPGYSRVFKKEETREIRLYGVSGEDIYNVQGNGDQGIKVIIVGGADKDSVTASGGGKKVHIYDDHKGNVFPSHARARKHLSSDSLVHAFDYDAFRPEKKGLGPAAGYTDEDRIYVGLKYAWQHQAFRRPPFAFRQTFGVNYSVSQGAVSVTYNGIFPKAVAGWDLLLIGNYDAVKWAFFYGLGNETSFSKTPRNFFRMRNLEWLGSIGINRSIGIGNITLSGFYNSVRILNNAGKFITTSYLPVHPESTRKNDFAGGVFNCNITHVDDSVVPLRGIIFNINARYTQNLTHTDRSFANFSGDAQFYIPLLPKLSLNLNAGAGTVTGTPEFYQYPAIGGASTLRGYNRERFRGKTAFYNSSEIRYITGIHNYLMNGKAGLVAFFDNGRVWMPGETSDAWHVGYGGGIIIAPFNIAFFDITYGISKETTQIQTRVTMKF